MTRLFVATFLAASLLTSCGGGAGGSGVVSPTATSPIDVPTVETGPALKPVQSGQWLAFVKNKLLTNPPAAVAPQNFGVATTAVSTAPPAPSAPVASVAAGADTSSASSPNYAGTQNQEAGIDEGDLVKTDGLAVYALRTAYYDYGVANANSASVGASLSTTLSAYTRTAAGSLSVQSTYRWGSQTPMTQLHLSADGKRLAVLGSEYSQQTSTPGSGPSVLPAVSTAAPPVNSLVASTSIAPIAQPVVAVDFLRSNAAQLSAQSQWRIDGDLVSSRQIGNYLYLVTQWSPSLSHLYTSTTAGITVNMARLNALTAQELLPQISVDGAAPSPLHGEQECYIQGSNASAYIRVTSITAIDLASSNLARTSRCFAGNADAVYVSPQHLYLSTSRYYSYADTAASTSFKADVKTDIHKFSLSGMSIALLGSGEVPGHLGWERARASYRMSEYQGDLRVLSFTGTSSWWGEPTQQGNSQAATASPATLSVLRESSSNTLAVIGSLPNAQSPQALGKPGEQVYAVRFLGERGYVVTFRRTDPLYILDLSVPTAPKTLGELQVTGYSDYLYPMTNDLLLGVGKEANAAGQVGGVKLALVDVSAPSNPRVVTSTVIGSTGSVSGLDYSPYGINIFSVGKTQRVALPVRVHSSTGSSFAQPTSQALYRFEVDTAARSMQAKPVVGQVLFGANPWQTASGRYDIASERALQIESDVYYFSGGTFVSAKW